MNTIKRLLAKQHQCKESDITIISPSAIPDVDTTTRIDIEYEINNKKHTCEVSVTPPVIIKR